MKYRSVNHFLKKVRRDCETKTVFRDRRAASWTAKRLTEETDQTFRVYRCEFGRHYHLSSH